MLINSNPATIMTDPELADRTYVEPITLDVVEKVIERERPDALLPTMGGQTALNATMGLVKRGTLEKYGVTLIGALRMPFTRRRIATPSSRRCNGSGCACRERDGTQPRGSHSCAGPRGDFRPSDRRSPWAARAATSPTIVKNLKN